jgi:hypothetical protein
MRAVLAPAVVAALLLSGCSSDSGEDPVQQPPAAQPAEQTPATPQTHQWGQAATVTGAEGGQLKVTPLGVLYHRGPYRGVDGPANGWFVAIALRIEALDRQDRLVAPAEGGGWGWRSGEQQIDTIDGNATSTPWVGEVPEFGDPILPGKPQAGVVTFDVPAKGGELQYTSADGVVTSWRVPAAATGSGLEKVRQRIKLFT